MLARIDVIATLFDMVGSIVDNISKGRAERNVYEATRIDGIDGDDGRARRLMKGT